MTSLYLLYSLIILQIWHISNAQISDQRLCYDSECKVPVSKAITLVPYPSPDKGLLSFPPNVEVTVYSKSAGSRTDLWGVEINEKRGYVPKHLLRELKVFKVPKLLVGTELHNQTESNKKPKVPSLVIPNNNVQPDKVKNNFEVVDGTTILLDSHEIVTPSTVENSIKPTVSSVTQSKTKKRAENASNLKTKETTKETSKTIEINDSTNKKVEDQSSFTIKTKDVNKMKGDNNENEEDTDFDDEDDGEVEDEDEEDEMMNSEENTDLSSTEATKNGEENEESQPKEIKSKTKKVVKDAKEEEKLEYRKEEALLSKVELPKTEEIKSGQNKESETVVAPNLEEIEEKSLNPEESKIAQISTEETVLVDSKVELSKIGGNQNEETKIPNLQESQEKSSSNPEESKSPRLSEETVLVDPKIEENDLGATPSSLDVTEDNFEIPNPIGLSENGASENPITKNTEESKNEDNIISTLPPLGLFANKRKEEAKKFDDQNEDLSLKLFEEDVKKSEEIAIQNNSNEVIAEDSIIFEDAKEKRDLGTKSEETNDLNSDSGVNSDDVSDSDEEINAESSGLISSIWSFFSGSASEPMEESQVDDQTTENVWSSKLHEKVKYCEDLASCESIKSGDQKVDHIENKNQVENHDQQEVNSLDKSDQIDNLVDIDSNQTENIEGANFLLNFNPDIFMYLVTTAVSVIIFLFGYIVLDKNKREGPLVAKINKLEREFLIILKENQILQEKASGLSFSDNYFANETIDKLQLEIADTQRVKVFLEEQVQSLEKELENSTEVGIELNRMLSEILTSQSGSDVIKANIEQLQRQLIEQQATINSVNESLEAKNEENHDLKLELDASHKKIFDLQQEVDKLLLNVFKTEEEKHQQQTLMKREVEVYKEKYSQLTKKQNQERQASNEEIESLKREMQHLEYVTKSKNYEYEMLVETLNELKSIKNNDGLLKNLLEVNEIKAQLQFFKNEKHRLVNVLDQTENHKAKLIDEAEMAKKEMQRYQEKYEEGEKLKVETQTKLDVLSNYFKEREAQLLAQLGKHEAMWADKEGETTSTTERIKFMHEELQNYKMQNETLKQEILSQEVELKSQISMLEKKVHENWVSARQAERKLDEARQEASQLRNRLTLREREIQGEKAQQNRILSPLEQNGDVAVSPLDSPVSPPIIFGGRDHLTKSPPIPGLPPFLPPPPPGVPFMPPLHGVPPFIPPPPNMFPVDHRPPPLGRMSSPPLNSRYSPDSRAYSPYDRNSPSSLYDSEYRISPPPQIHKGFYNNRDYKRPPPPRNNGPANSSGSGHSDESLGKINRHHSKI